jgi:VIT1/CCC1 family predicted Fe2+/Mn2+ transporter
LYAHFEQNSVEGFQLLGFAVAIHRDYLRAPGKRGVMLTSSGSESSVLTYRNFRATIRLPRRIMEHKEHHRTHRTGWLRAAVLGANDGIVSTASLLLGVTAAHVTHHGILVAGISGLVAGAMAMAAGEYVSVSSQADTEEADLAIESEGLETDEKAEREELAGIYVMRGLDPGLAKEVAEQLMVHDALGAHARDELGISETLKARPLQAALASAASFTVGAVIPLLTAVVVLRTSLLVLWVGGVSLTFLALLGGLAARVGGARVTVGALRVLLWGAVAMGLTIGVGLLFRYPA